MAQLGGRFILSEAKIKEYEAAGLTSDNYTTSELYTKTFIENLIANCTITKLSKLDHDASLYGLIYKLTLNHGVESPVVNIKINEANPNYGNYGQKTCSMNTFFRKPCLTPVRTFLMKLSFLSNAHEISMSYHGIELKRTVLKRDFGFESSNQNIAYEKTFDFGESVVPACISVPYIQHIENEGVINPIFDALTEPEIDDDAYLIGLQGVAKTLSIKEFGLILMEYAEGFVTLKSVMENDAVSARKKLEATNLAKMAHLVLFEKGIMQGDSHKSNVMVNLTYDGFLGSGIKGKALVIDFGRSVNISKEDYQRVGLQKDDPITEDLYNNIFSLMKWQSNGRGKSGDHPPYRWIAEPDFTDEYGVISDMIGSRRRRSNVLRQRISHALPNLIRKEYLFAQFLAKPDFEQFNHLRWHDVINAYNYNSPPKVLSPTLSPQSLGPVQYRGLVTPISAAPSDPKVTSLPPLRVTPKGRSRVANVVSPGIAIKQVQPEKQAQAQAQAAMQAEAQAVMQAQAEAAAKQAEAEAAAAMHAQAAMQAQAQAAMQAKAKAAMKATPKAQAAMKELAAIYAPPKALPFLKLVNPKEHARIANLFAQNKASALAHAPAALPPLKNPRVRAKVANLLKVPLKVHKGSGSKAKSKAKNRKTRKNSGRTRV